SLVAAALCAAPAAAADKLEKAEDKAKSATQEMKTAVSDTWLTAKTKIALFGDERVKGTQVSVETIKGVIHLRGKVDSELAKGAADEVAKNIEGVKGVKNDLQVVPPVARKFVDPTDNDITKAVEARFAKDPQLKKIDVRSDAGVVILKGEVPSITASAKASELARQIPGVRAVKNELTYSGKAAARTR
ncbi:MAG TPA: BON domain-containing protein, partial [Methylomirabilota bacterium]|nr:BON domain-containing protein [Methylomirabilota bacterium]